MTASRRQMHLAVFWLGTGNHSAGWRMDGAFTTSVSVPVMQSIAAIAERGKFDLFFICLLYTSPSPRDPKTSRMPSSA